MRVRSTTIESAANDWIILCDFDGTVSRDDVTDTILERFAAPGHELLEERWQRGEIGSATCMTGQVALLEVAPEELAAYLESVEIDAQFPAFFAAATEAGIPLIIGSDGLDVVISGVLRHHALPALPIVSNKLVASGARRWQLQMPFNSPDCIVASATCKCAAAARLRRGWRRVLLIGDGTSDFCVARRADYVLAKGRLADHCRSEGIAHTPIKHFGDALVFLAQIATLTTATSIINREQECLPHA